MKFLSLFSGIESASVAWNPLGWRAQAFSEIERFPSAVLKHRWPEVPNLGDVTKFKDWPNYESIDLLVGGSPCQSFSVAGLRKGLADPRGNLMLTFGAVAGRYRPRWLVWENVPGVLSSNKGRDFGTFLGMLGQLGYGFAYRVLDTQHFGVPQRRRRVFVVGHLGDWRRSAAVLFERESLRGDSAPSRETQEGVASYASSGLGKYREGVGTLRAGGGGSEMLIGTLNASGAGTSRPAGQCNELDFCITHSLRADGFDASEDGTGRGTPLVVDTLTSSGDANSGFRDEKGLVVFGHQEGRNFKASEHTTSALTKCQGLSIGNSDAVRRLTPTECERLQGFSDGYTAIRGAKDGPRYKALGNSMAVPVMRWIGERIASVDAL